MKLLAVIPLPIEFSRMRVRLPMLLVVAKLLPFMGKRTPTEHCSGFFNWLRYRMGKTQERTQYRKKIKDGRSAMKTTNRHDTINSTPTGGGHEDDGGRRTRHKRESRRLHSRSQSCRSESRRRHSRKISVTTRKISVTTRKISVTTRKISVTTRKISVTTYKISVTTRKIFVTIGNIRVFRTQKTHFCRNRTHFCRKRTNRRPRRVLA